MTPSAPFATLALRIRVALPQLWPPAKKEGPLANPKHLEILKQGVETWNQWRTDHPDIRPDLAEAELSGTNLSGVNLNGTDLSKADLRGVKLSRANLSGADLFFADLCEANLNGANLNAADLSWTNLNGANLRGADVKGVNVGGTIFANLDLSQVKGLENIHHWSPSSVGTDTVYRSQGKIPEIFLRGAGVPDNFIEYMRSLAGPSFEYHSCFISYSTKDQEFAERLYADLQAKGVRCWFAPHDMKGGKKIHEQIDRAIQFQYRVLLILSPASMSSNWVKTEISKARKREEAEKRDVLFPIRLVDYEIIQKWECFDEDIGLDSAKVIRGYFIPDFSHWQQDHNSYKQAFERLLRDLQDQAEQAAGA